MNGIVDESIRALLDVTMAQPRVGTIEAHMPTRRLRQTSRLKQLVEFRQGVFFL